ncbi:MAG: hypothetical protein K6G33_14455 [Ruminococcus sp.]|uniref:hypothetical protein n=1 Tax=Ruminococcus sp. TaxID=41978 RepID=UPI0025FE49DE|nr:hypothetical protein [Ruminococcus sp.]MCR5601924.1 hypothetical protein [Ruminococcus sp.]
MRPNEYDELIGKIKCSDEFRSRMQEKLSSAPDEAIDYKDSVSGTEVITVKHRFSKFAAMAAAVVLVCGAVGGGVYRFTRINNRTEESTDINTDEKASVYSRLKANKDSYSAEIRLWEDLSGDIYSKYNIDKDKFFEYLDHFDMSKGIGADDFTSTLRGIKIFFNGIDENAKGVTYSFELFDNGELRLTEKVKSEERVSYHSYVDGQRVFNDILYMLVDDEETIAEFEKVTNKELENEISNGFKNNSYDKAYYYIADENRQEEYTLTGREDFAYELMEFEWERASVISGDVNSYSIGFVAAEDGYMQFSSGMTYKLKNDSDLEAYNAVLKKHLIKKEFGEAVSEEDILNAFKDIPDEKAQFFDESEFKNTFYKYNESDFESFKEKLAALEWETCSKVEHGMTDLTVKDCLIDREGVIIPANKSNLCYKLKNESDKAEFQRIFDEFMDGFEKTESE